MELTAFAGGGAKAADMVLSKGWLVVLKELVGNWSDRGAVQSCFGACLSFDPVVFSPRPAKMFRVAGRRGRANCTCRAGCSYAPSSAHGKVH